MFGRRLVLLVIRSDGVCLRAWARRGEDVGWLYMRPRALKGSYRLLGYARRVYVSVFSVPVQSDHWR